MIKLFSIEEFRCTEAIFLFMYIGEDQVIQSSDVVSIINLNVVYSSVVMEEMMSSNIKKGLVLGNKATAKSVIITIKEIYYSPLSIITLKKRSTMLSTLSKLDDYTDEIDSASESE